MGDLETTNMFIMDSMKTRLRHKNHMIAHLQTQLKDTEKNISEEINKGLEHSRSIDK
jgi:hypothetical protein